MGTACSPGAPASPRHCSLSPLSCPQPPVPAWQRPQLAPVITPISPVVRGRWGKAARSEAVRMEAVMTEAVKREELEELKKEVVEGGEVEDGGTRRPISSTIHRRRWSVTSPRLPYPTAPPYWHDRGWCRALHAAARRASSVRPVRWRRRTRLPEPRLQETRLP